MTYLARDVSRALEALAPLDSGVPHDELGFVFGDPAAVVSGVGCAWSVDAASIGAAAAMGLDMIICHEHIWHPVQESPWYDGPPAAAIHSNTLRRSLLEQHAMVVYRSHSNWDALPADGVADQAVAALGIEGLSVVGSQRFFRVHELPEAWSVERLRRQTASGLGFADCRVFGDASLEVRRFAFLIGGFGENQFNMPQAARDMGAEALIIGEMSEFVVIASLEMGLPVIEALHSVSEIPAVRRQAELLAAALPGLPVRYVPSGAAAYA